MRTTNRRQSEWRFIEFWRMTLPAFQVIATKTVKTSAVIHADSKVAARRIMLESLASSHVEDKPKWEDCGEIIVSLYDPHDVKFID
jgi:hypothetical protein